VQFQHFLNGAGDGTKLSGREAGQRPFDQSLVVDGSELVHEQIRIFPQFALGLERSRSGSASSMS
jgi:hypothetical protein